ncbi:hypothetical protein NLI96_g2714 [Meripilus lineatus]|uniref:Uncharacterized protein n=1 Tax=Meripilus lineatus TaxID=2056292 RepID=A0AAD5V9M7_9APHY|nr:hypothetical protein NLI96_g2714 [Physisporinus lineatus]
MARFAFAGLIALASSALLANGAELSRREETSLERRTTQPPPLIGCYPGGVGGCPCPKDKFGDSGVLINFFPGYQCAYPGGACSWDDQSGQLQNQAQTNCPSSAPCPSTGCTCPLDNNGDTGVLINYFTGYQCAYPHGACTWDSSGALANTAQGNCPSSAACGAFGGKPKPPKNHPFPFPPNFWGIWWFLPWW